MGTQNRDQEHEWIASCRLGDPEAFGKLVERHQQGVYGFILRLSGNSDMADDMTQETFVTAWQKLSSFQEAGPFRAWLFRIALNKVRSQWRWQKLRNWLSLDSLRQDEESTLEEKLADRSRDANPETSIADPKLERTIQDALRLLPARQKEVILLRAQGLAIQEIASVLNLAEGTIKAHLFEAKKRLQEKLKLIVFP